MHDVGCQGNNRARAASDLEVTFGFRKERTFVTPANGELHARTKM